MGLYFLKFCRLKKQFVEYFQKTKIGWKGAQDLFSLVINQLNNSKLTF